MKTIVCVALLALTATFAFAQPAPMMRPDNLPELDYRPVADIFNLPANANFGSTSAVAVNSKGNIIVLNRAPAYPHCCAFKSPTQVPAATRSARRLGARVHQVS